MKFLSMKNQTKSFNYFDVINTFLENTDMKKVVGFYVIGCPSMIESEKKFYRDEILHLIL